MSSLGDKLREERVKRGFSLKEVAEETRIREEFLAALERGEFAGLPGGAFNRGFVRSYALKLGLDPEPLVRAYEEEEETQTLDGRLPEKRDVLDELRESVADGSGGRLVEMVRRNGAMIATIGGIAVLAGLGIAGWRIVPGLTAEGSSSAAATSRSAGAHAVSDDASAATTARGARHRDAASDESPAGTIDASDEPGAAKMKTAEKTTSGDVGESASPTDSSGSDVETWVVTSAAPAKTAPSAKPAVDETAAVVSEPKPAAAPTGSRETAVARKDPAPTVQAAEAAEPVKTAPKAPAARPPRLTVSESGLGVAVVDRELVGVSSQFREGESVYFWTRVVGGEPGDEIRHVWLRNGKAKGLVELPVNASQWRTHSRFDLAPGSAGPWVVEARDANGNVLARTEFVCR